VGNAFQTATHAQAVDSCSQPETWPNFDGSIVSFYLRNATVPGEVTIPQSLLAPTSTTNAPLFYLLAGYTQPWAFPFLDDRPLSPCHQRRPLCVGSARCLLLATLRARYGRQSAPATSTAPAHQRERAPACAVSRNLTPRCRRWDRSVKGRERKNVALTLAWWVLELPIIYVSSIFVLGRPICGGSTNICGW
jgi:hypothetical protein